MNDIIKITNLNKIFGKNKALSDLSVNIAENSITGLIGRNGSGKTTLMKIIAGLLDKTSGEVQVFGQQPMDNLNVLNRLVYTYHNMNYDSNLNLKTILYSYDTMFPDFDVQFADRLMKFFELTGKMKYKNLSQGMGSVFNFLCALSCRASITMLDEPVLGMDVTVRKSAYEILLRDFIEHPRTFIISSHLLSELEGVLSDILLINEGKLVFNSPIDELQQSAYRVDGGFDSIKSFISGKRVIAQKSNELSCYAVIYESITHEDNVVAQKNGLKISAVRAEDLCGYLIGKDKEAELECLW